jgi:type I restriction enzyme, S subunit
MYNIQERQIVLKDVMYIDVTPAELELYGLLEGDILINRVNSAELVGKAALIPPGLGDCVFESKNIRVRIDQDRALPAYIVYVLDTPEIKREVERKGKRAIGQVTINQDDLTELLIPLPTLLTQQKIISSLDKEMAMIMQMRAEAARQQEALTSMTGVLLREVFESEEAQRWESIELKRLTEKIGSGLTPEGGQNTYQSNGVPLIRSMNVHNNRFVSKGLAYITSEIDEEMANSRVQPGDVLLNITGASIGRACVVPDEVCPANVNQHVSIIRPIPELLDSAFLSFTMTQPKVLRSILSAQAGATRQALTKSQIEEFEIPLPAISEQHRIVSWLKEKLAQTNRLKAEASRQVDAINALPAAALREVFGEFVPPHTF